MEQASQKNISRIKELLPIAIQKSLCSSAFSFHPLSRIEDEEQKEIYLSLLVSAYRAMGAGEKQKEFLCKLFNCLKKEFPENESLNDERLLHLLERFNPGRLRRFFLVDLFLLASLGDFSKSLPLLKEFLIYLNFSPEEVREIISIVRYLLSLKNPLSYGKEVEQITTGEMVIEESLVFSDRIFLDCTFKFKEKGSLNFNGKEKVYFLNCTFINPVINIKHPYFVKFINCKFYNGLSPSPKIIITDVYQVELKGNILFLFEKLRDLFSFSQVRHLITEENRFEVWLCKELFEE